MKWPWHEKQAKRGHECRSRAFPAARPARRAGPRAPRGQATPRAADFAATPPIVRCFLSRPAVPPAISVPSPHSAWPLRQVSASHADSLYRREGPALLAAGRWSFGAFWLKRDGLLASRRAFSRSTLSVLCRGSAKRALPPRAGRGRRGAPRPGPTRGNVPQVQLRHTRTRVMKVIAIVQTIKAVKMNGGTPPRGKIRMMKPTRHNPDVGIMRQLVQ
jgi:hypothetical protein